MTGDVRAATINAMIRNKQKTPSLAAADTRIFELQADICQTLANPKRLQIVNLLKQGEVSAGSMAEAMGIAKANLSQHLSIMRQKGILIARREGTAVYYRLASPRITAACTIMKEVLMDLLEGQETLSKSVREAGRKS